MSWAWGPIKTSPSLAPAIVRTCFGRPTHDGKKHLGVSSPAKPALMVPLPLSSTMGALCNLVLTAMVVENMWNLVAAETKKKSDSRAGGYEAVRRGCVCRVK